MNSVFRVIKTAVVKCIHPGKIKIRGFLNISHDTKIRISDNGKISFGKNMSTFSNVHLSAAGGKLEIGDNVFFNRNCIVVCREAITIGDGCICGPNVCIYDHDHKYGYEGVSSEYKTGPVIIGENCWIGANTVILRGTHICANSVIGAGTVVKGNIPPHSIAYSSRELVVDPIEKDSQG